jgi:hypothetical protein
MDIARANGIRRKKTVSKKTGIDKTKPLARRTNPAFFSPKTDNKYRTIFSAAPLCIMQVPTMAAKAIKSPMPPAVLPKPSKLHFIAYV